MTTDEERELLGEKVGKIYQRGSGSWGSCQHQDLRKGTNKNAFSNKLILL